MDLPFHQSRASISALRIYHDAMQIANYHRIRGKEGFDFEAAAAQNKQELRRRLERASQKNGPPPRGPVL